MKIDWSKASDSYKNTLDWNKAPAAHVRFAGHDTEGTWYWMENGVTWRVDSGELERPEHPIIADSIVRMPEE